MSSPTICRRFATSSVLLAGDPWGRGRRQRPKHNSSASLVAREGGGGERRAEEAAFLRRWRSGGCERRRRSIRATFFWRSSLRWSSLLPAAAGVEEQSPLVSPLLRCAPRVPRCLPLRRRSVRLHLLSLPKSLCLSFCMACWRRCTTVAGRQKCNYMLLLDSALD
jgi:hypothetical protein